MIAPLELEDKSKVVLVTTTFSPSLDDMRAQLAFKTCLAARKYGYKIIVIDGSPCAEFKEYLRKTGAIVINQIEAGMGGSRRQALKAGLECDTKVIVWLEPEKHTLVPLLEPCIFPVLEGLADIVVTRRKNLDSYPQYQQLSEYRGNWELGNITGYSGLDLFSGPRIMNQKTASVMVGYNNGVEPARYGDKWEILFIPILWMIRMNMRVKSVIVDYIHPQEQLVEDSAEMQAKRDEQRTCLVNAMRSEAQRLNMRGSYN